jgi:hypothetical protein
MEIFMMFLDEYNLKNDFLGFSLIFQPHVVIEFRVVTRLIKKTQERTMRCSLLRQKKKKKKLGANLGCKTPTRVGFFIKAKRIALTH